MNEKCSSWIARRLTSLITYIVLVSEITRISVFNFAMALFFKFEGNWVARCCGTSTASGSTTFTRSGRTAHGECQCISRVLGASAVGIVRLGVL